MLNSHIQNAKNNKIVLLMEDNNQARDLLDQIDFLKLEIFGQLGKGSFGTVYAAKSKIPEKWFALKSIPKFNAKCTFFSF